MRVLFILDAVDPALAANRLAEFDVEGTLWGKSLTASCEFHVDGARALFLGPNGTYGKLDWIDWEEGWSRFVVCVEETYDKCVDDVDELWDGEASRLRAM